MPLPCDRPSTLRDLYAETDQMHVVCTRCGLDERWPLAQEIAFHGPATLVWTVAEAVAEACPRKDKRRPTRCAGSVVRV